MAISKVILNGNTLMDVTQDTVQANNLLSGNTATKNDGTKVNGSYTPPTFSTQTKSVTPTESAQTVTPDSGYDGLSQVNVGAVSSTYVGTGVTRKSAQTYTPTTTDQTIASGQYLTGVQTIKGDANLIAANIADGVSIFGVTGTHSGGGGTTHVSGRVLFGSKCYYTTPSGTITTVEPDPMTSEIDIDVLAGSMLVIFDAAGTEVTLSNATYSSTLSLGSRATYKYAIFYQVS